MRKKLSNFAVTYLSKTQAYEIILEKLTKSGCSEDNSLGIAEGILDAEFSGIKSHGFHYLPIYCNHLKIGKINGKASPTFEKISNSSLKVDADNGFAHKAINIGLKHLCEMSFNQAISCMSIYNSYNCGVLGFHTKRIAEKNLIGLGFTNAPASIAPFGAIRPVIGTNPYSIAAPLNGKPAIIIDQSASVVAKSEISVRAKTDDPIPPGWAFDKEGKVTTNAKEALKGSMAPSGGYKGFSTGLLVEILTACVAGGNLGTQASSFAGEDGGPPSTGQFFIAINPKKFNQDFESHLNQLLNSISSQEGSRVPGSKRLRAFNENVDNNIFISKDLMSRIDQI